VQAGKHETRRLDMSKLAYFAVITATVALLVSIAGLGVTAAAPDAEWSVPMVADAGVEGSNADLEFGIHPDGTDGYDSGIDSLSPPPGPGALFEVYFSIVDTLFPMVNKDLRGEVPNEWTLDVRSTDEDIELSWNTADVPQGVALRLIGVEADIDMKAVDTMTLPAGANTISIVAEQIEVGQYGLTISSTSGGSATVPGEGTFVYDGGTVVSLIAEAEEGYRFTNWTGDVDTVANVNAASTTITVDDDYEITANFEETSSPPPTSTLNTLTINSTDGGSIVAPGEGSFTYDERAVVSLVAEAEAGYQFVSWTGNVDTIDATNVAETTITMDDDYEITANFEEISSPPHPSTLYALDVSSTGGGSVSTPGEGTFEYDGGAVVDLVAEAEEGHQFVSWTGDVDTIANVNAASTTITMQGDYTIMADFDQIQQPINWPLIGGIVAAVVAAGLVVFFLRGRRFA
jgi:hypothetical protein